MAAKRSNCGVDNAASDPSSGSSAVRLDNASATMFIFPGFYSTEKSNPISLLTQRCCGIVDKR